MANLWFYCSCVKVNSYNILANRSWEKFDELTSHICTFYVTQSFLSRDPFGFWSLGYPGIQGLGWQGYACVKNLPWVGGEVCAKFGGDWSNGSGVKRVHRYKQSLLHGYQMAFFKCFHMVGVDKTGLKQSALSSFPTFCHINWFKDSTNEMKLLFWTVLKTLFIIRKWKCSEKKLRESGIEPVH